MSNRLSKTREQIHGAFDCGSFYIKNFSNEISQTLSRFMQNHRKIFENKIWSLRIINHSLLHSFIRSFHLNSFTDMLAKFRPTKCFIHNSEFNSIRNVLIMQINTVEKAKFISLNRMLQQRVRMMSKCFAIDTCVNETSDWKFQFGTIGSKCFFCFFF